MVIKEITKNICDGGIIIVPLNFWSSIRKCDIKLRSDFLEKYKIEYEENKNLDNILFQFYLSKNRIVIEYLSREHYLIKDIDKLKENYCEDNYIDLIIIKYNQFDDIYQILWNNLKNIIVDNNKFN